MAGESARAEVERHFPSDIAKHVATIALDNGLFRQIRCQEPGTYNRYFEVTTWPGHLAITGDMHSFVFSRLQDMFEFFEGSHGHVNLQYWAEKLIAADPRGGYEAFSEDRFREAVERRFAEWLEDRSLDSETIAELRERLYDEVLSRAEYGEAAAVMAAMEFGHNRRTIFTDFYEHRLREYTYHYVWCCHAIVWAIAQYRTQKAAAESLEVAHA